MLKDNAEINFQNLEKVPIPVDRHIARATLTLGILRGQFYGSIESLYKKIREVWFKIAEDLNFKIFPLKMDIHLWCLSKYWCSKNRDNEKGECKIKERCFLNDFCVKGKIILKDNRAEIDTELNNYF